MREGGRRKREGRGGEGKKVSLEREGGGEGGLKERERERTNIESCVELFLLD